MFIEVMQIGKSTNASDKSVLVCVKCILLVSKNLALQPSIILYLFTFEILYSLQNICFFSVLN